MPTITLTLSSDRLESLTDIVSLTCARCVRDGSVSVNVGLLDDDSDVVLDSVPERVKLVPYVAPEPEARPMTGKRDLDERLKAKWFTLHRHARRDLLLKHVCTTCRAAANMPCRTAGGAEYAMGLGHASRARLAAREYFGIKS